MNAEWMGRYRRLIAAIVVQGNLYARQQGLRHEVVPGVWMTAQEWQILEYTVEGQNESSNMNAIAHRLAIPQSTLSKTVTRLCKMGMVEKYQSMENRKNVILRATATGDRAYQANAKVMSVSMFGRFFTALEHMDDANLEVFTQAMEALTEDLAADGVSTEQHEAQARPEPDEAD